MDKLYIVMPAYNEEANIASVVKAWYPVLEGKDPSSRLLIADSGSTDRTHDILLSLQADYPALEILPDTLKQHGPKVIALYDHAIRQGADYIFQTDSDGQTDPGEFAAFWDQRGSFDAILGHRKQRGDGRSRAFVEHVVCLLLRIHFKVRVPDANAPFRLMRADCLKLYLHKLPCDYNIPNIMLTAYLVHNGHRVEFREITFRPRQGGVNSVNIPRIIRIGFRAIRDFRSFKKDFS